MGAYGEKADGTLSPLQDGEKEYLFRVVLLPAVSLYTIGVYRGFTVEQARTHFMMGIMKSKTPAPPCEMELWINELLPVRVQTPVLP